MQCSSCFDEEIHGTGFGRVVKKSHLEMEHVCSEDGYDYYQCPRCMMTRKKGSGFCRSGLIENTTSEEAKKALEKASSGAGVLGAIVLIGAAALLCAAAASGTDEQ